MKIGDSLYPAKLDILEEQRMRAFTEIPRKGHGDERVS